MNERPTFEKDTSFHCREWLKSGFGFHQNNSHMLISHVSVWCHGGKVPENELVQVGSAVPIATFFQYGHLGRSLWPYPFNPLGPGCPMQDESHPHAFMNANVCASKFLVENPLNVNTLLLSILSVHAVHSVH